MNVVITENEPLAKYTSWRIGGPARYFVAAPTTDDLLAAIDWAHERSLPVLVLGGGTNMLVRDNGFPGLVLRLRRQELHIDEQAGRVWVAAGAPMAGTARRLAAQGWAGLEWAEGLPGTIGGAVFGNAGCYGGDIASSLVRAWVLRGREAQEWPVEQLHYGYRTSVLKATNDGYQPFSVGPIVLAAEFAIARADPRLLADRMAQTAAERRGKTPVGSSCGSVFKNPTGGSAGRLIEAAGLKGTRVGGAEVSHQHANYIVNRGGASSEDILQLVDIVREHVAKEHGIALELEVQIIG
jgi:UDP-N-acetylmuramate dehydrogenase